MESEKTGESVKSLNSNIIIGLKDAFPIMIGYFSVSMAFGLIVKNADLLLSDGILFSTVVFAGASQFMALNMLTTGSGWISIIAATFLLNFRHFIMSASLGSRLQRPRRWQIPIIAFGVTDETFSVDMAREGSLPPVYIMSVHFFAWASWGAGTVSGYVLGSFIPDALGSSLGMGLYVLFMSLLVPEIKKGRKALWVALTAAALNTIFGYVPYIGSNWSLVCAVVASALIFTFLNNSPKEAFHE
ncbi:MAG: AzlC family ABC transporter permease [Spirochaetales bacterium]|nr:AzlC family ABC transporter permease [Spirochaetales bacterium]